jgi:hypothetical protein
MFGKFVVLSSELYETTCRCTVEISVVQHADLSVELHAVLPAKHQLLSVELHVKLSVALPAERL